MRIFSLIFILQFCAMVVFGQTYHNKHKVFFYWGYNRSTYTKSDIHLTSDQYDITFYKVKSQDRPSKFGKVYFDPARLSIPQYNIRLGYYITDRVSISFGSDHMKYVVNANQTVEMSGVIHSTLSPQYNGNYFHDTVQLKSDLLQFEHSDGLNVATIELDYAQPLLKWRKLKLNGIVGLGGVWVITRTDVKVLNDGINNDFHLSGYTMLGKAGFRTEYGKYFFIVTESKAGYVSLPDVPIHNREAKHADQNFSFLEFYGAIGVKYPLF